jgi:hypothetical protein
MTAFVCLTLARHSASADQPNSAAAEGIVVQVERDDLVLDVGSLRGAIDNDVAEIWRPLKVRHPVTGKLVVDRFLIGRLRLVQVRPNLSLAKPEGQLARDALGGDIVVLPRPEAPRSSSPAAPASCPPTAPALTPSEPRAAAREKNPDRLEAEVQPMELVVAEQPLHVAVSLRGAPIGAVLHVRKADDDSYASQPMTKMGPEYWAATVPAAAVQTPSLEWFVEAIEPEGARPVVGDAAKPETAIVEDVRPKAPRTLLGQAQVWTDYASFNTKANNDHVWQTEGVMGARLDDSGIRALRMGFGVYRGVGGTLYQLDVLNQPPNSVGLTYGYLESEFGLAPTLSIAARAIIGLRDDGLNGGASAFVRIGSDLATNLLLGGEVLGGIGLRGITQFEWNSFKRFPIVLRSEVMSQPAGVGSDVGVRMISQVGYRLLPHLVVAGRFSYQGRTIDHAGPGGGASVGYTW